MSAEESDPEGPAGPDDEEPQVHGGPRRSGEDEARLPPGVDALQAAAREAIDATRALLDVAEDMVNDPEMADRFGAMVRAATGAVTRAARSAGRVDTSRDDDPDDGDGVQSIPVS